MKSEMATVNGIELFARDAKGSCTGCHFFKNICVKRSQSQPSCFSGDREDRRSIIFVTKEQYLYLTMVEGESHEA